MKVAATLDTPWISLPEPKRQERRSTRPPTDSLLLAALVGRAQANDESAWRELIGLYQYRIAGFVLAIVGRGEAVEDLTQQVFVKLVRNLGQLRSPLTFESW